MGNPSFSTQWKQNTRVDFKPVCLSMWFLCFRGRYTDSPQCLLGESVMRRLVISDGKAEIYNIWSFLTHGVHMKWLPVCCCCNTVKQREIMIHKPAGDNKMQDCVYLLWCLECGFVYFPW